MGFTVALRDTGDNMDLESEIETATADLLWSNTAAGASKAAVTIPSGGSYSMRFTAQGQKPNVTGAFYICGLHLD